MTREFKFRGYNKGQQKWFYGNYVDGYLINGVVESTDEYITIENWMPVNPDTVGQFIGLKDKKEIKIYEGDIVRVIRSYDEIDFIGEVVFQDCSFAIKGDAFTMYDWPSYEIEVLGNVYENIELLEVEDEN